MIIAIDGPAASGKGTIGRNLAQHYGLRYLDTGILYRAVAKGLLDKNLDLHNEADALTVARSLKLQDLLNHSNDLLMDYGTPAAVVAAFPAVRQALLGLQRDFAAKPPGAVLDGRDIGTVICPDADVKIYVTATPEVRARRRAAEYQAQGRDIDEAAVLADIIKRDERDSQRAAAPLKQAKGAHLLDTTHLAIDPAIRAAIDIVEATRAGRGRG
jgi:cytidylate kinase